jgi:hypothetical protein
MFYSLCKFEYGYEGMFYMICSNGEVVRYADMDGNTLELTPPYGYNIINSNPPLPSWA